MFSSDFGMKTNTFFSSPKFSHFSNVLKNSTILFSTFQFQAEEKKNFFFKTSVVYKGKNERANWTKNDTYAGEDAFFISKNKKILGIAGNRSKIRKKKISKKIFS